MKFGPILIANLKRKKIRSILTIGSFAVALSLFGLLATIQTAFNQGMEIAGADRLVVINKVSLIMPLPYAYKERLLQVPGIKDATFATWFGGVYQNERNWFPQFAIEKESWREMYPEFKVSDGEWNAFLNDKEGCIAGRLTADKYGWKIGDRIPLMAPMWGGTWEFNLVGIYEGSRKEDDTTQFWFRWDYLEERRSISKGTVGWYVVRVENTDKAAEVVKAIDQRFENSTWETSAQTEKAFQAGFAKQIGNIQLLIMSIGSVVFFTLLLVTGNTLSMSVRERTPELAVLKTIGFSDISVLILVLAESLIYAVLGGSIGLAAVKLFTLQGDPTGGFLPFFYLAPWKMGVGMGVAGFVGLASGLIPAILAMRLKIVDALRRI
jgi:putative ABC transport system permease protein